MARNKERKFSLPNTTLFRTQISVGKVNGSTVDVQADYWNRSTNFSYSQFRPMRFIYFVCMSNTCRSPMAEHLMKEKLALENLQHMFEVRSRGITDAYEKPGSPASSQGVEVLRNDYNIDMSSHKSALLTETDVNEAHMIIPVKRDLGRHIAHMYPDSVPKLIFLPHDISDPWHQPVSVYRNCAQDVYGMLDAIVVELKASLTADKF